MIDVYGINASISYGFNPLCSPLVLFFPPHFFSLSRLLSDWVINFRFPLQTVHQDQHQNGGAGLGIGGGGDEGGDADPSLRSYASAYPVIDFPGDGNGGGGGLGTTYPSLAGTKMTAET